jgi:ketosteroid isomerase-like protein
MRGRGKTSGVNVETEFANLLDIRDGSVVALTLYSDRDRALVDLGLAPRGSAADAARD